LTTKKVIDAIVKQQDLFQAMHDAQLTLVKTLIVDAHAITRHEIIQDIRVGSLSRLINEMLNCF
jgi:hypothetical protein